MPSTKQLQRQFQGIQDVRQPVRKKYHALVGHPDGTTIQDPETAGFVFVRINGNEDRVERALCREVLQRYNQPVIVAYSDELPNTLEVIKLDVNASAPQSGGSSWDGSAQLGAHAGQHALYGGDTIWVNIKQILPLRIRPQEPNSMRVYVESGPYQYKLGFNYWPGGYSSDMTAQVPGAGLQFYRIIYINASTNALAYINSGTMPIDPYSADFEAILDLIPTDCVPLSAVRLYNGMTSIAEAGIYDLRSFVSSAPGTAASRMIWDNVVVVSPSGGDYTTITAALAAITDASSSNRYIVLIAPGNYGESITAKPYVSLVGLSRQECIITAQGSGNAITIPTTAGDYYISDLKTTGGVGTSGIVMTGAAPGLVYIDRCDNVSPNAVVMASTDAVGLMTLRDCEITGGGSGVLIGNSQNGHLTLIDCQAISSGFYCIQQANTPTLIISGGYYSATQAIDWSNGSTITFRNFPVLVGTISGTGTTTMTGAYLDSGGVVKLTNGATAASGKFIDALTDGSTGGFRAGTTSDVLWYRGVANRWDTPDSVAVAGNLAVSGASLLASVGVNVVITYAGDVSGLQFRAIASAAATAVTGVLGRAEAGAGSFTVVNAYDFYAQNPAAGAGSTITNAYGLYIENITTGGTLNYAIYTGTGLVRFGDAVTATTLSLTATSNQIVLQSAGVTGTLTWTPATSNKVITLPNATGTVALLEVANVFTAIQAVNMASAPYWFIKVSGTDKAFWGVATAANQFVTGSAANDVVFRAETANILLTADGGTTIAATINSSSNFGIGIAPSYRLDVYTTAAAMAAKIKNFNGTDAGGGLWIDTRWNTAANKVLRLTSNNEATEIFTVYGDGGAVMGAPTGGNKGAGTLNVAGDIYKNNSAYANPAYVLEQWANGVIVQFADRPSAQDYRRMTLGEIEAYIRSAYHLPGFEQSDLGLFSGGDLMLEKVEELFTHLIEMDKRLQLVEAQAWLH